MDYGVLDAKVPTNKECVQRGIRYQYSAIPGIVITYR